MNKIKQYLRERMREFVALIPERIFQLLITLWLEKVAQKEELNTHDRDSLILGFNLWFDRLNREENLKNPDRELLQSIFYPLLQKISRQDSETVMRPTFYALLEQVSRQDVKMAMRSLLDIEDSLTNQIDRVAVKYDNGIHVKHRLTKYHDFFTERIKSGDRVLDIGCGNGSLAYDIAVRSGGIVTGIDLNTELIQFARERFLYPNLTFIEENAWTYKSEEGFDVIVLSNVLEHIENRIEFLQGLSENFNPKRILIRVPAIDRHWLVPLRKELGLFYFSDITHYTEYTQQSFEKEVKMADLQIEHLQINWGEIWAEAIVKSKR